MIELLPVMAGIALSAVTLWYLRCFARSAEAFSRQFRRDAATLLELRYRKEANNRLHSTQAFTESVIDSGTVAASTAHHKIASIPFRALESIPATRATARVVREAHDIVSDFVYGSFRVANKAAGKYARNAIEESTRGPNGRSDNRSTGPGSR